MRVVTDDGIKADLLSEEDVKSLREGGRINMIPFGAAEKTGYVLYRDDDHYKISGETVKHFYSASNAHQQKIQIQFRRERLPLVLTRSAQTIL